MTISFGGVIGGGITGASATSYPEYDAIVYQTDTYTLAVDKNGDILSTGKISAANDNVQITAALDYLDGLCNEDYTKGYKLFINTGTYKINSPIYVNFPHDICGNGSDSTKLIALTPCANAMFILNYEENDFVSDAITLKDMELNGDYKCRYGVIFQMENGLPYGLHSSYTKNTRFTDLVITGFLFWGVVDNSLSGSRYTNCIFRDNNILYTSTGLGTALVPFEITTPLPIPPVSMAILPSTFSEIAYENNFLYLWWLCDITGGGMGGFGTAESPVVSNETATPSLSLHHSILTDLDFVYLVPPYGNVLVFGVSDAVFTGCVFERALHGIVYAGGDGGSFFGCRIAYNDFHGVYTPPMDDTLAATTYSVHFNGIICEDNGQYNVEYGASFPIYDFIIISDDPLHGTVHNSGWTLTDIYTRSQTGITESLNCNGDYTTLLNYICETGAIGTLAGTGSQNINTIATTSGALIYKGVIDCSADPDYPAGTVGDLYVVSLSGNIGGAGGIAVSPGYMVICNTDNAGGDQATVGASWDVVVVGSEPQGFDTVAATTTSIDVAHGLGGVPTTVTVTPTDDLFGRSYWVDTIDAVTFRINISVMDLVDHIFYWKVS